MQKMRGGAAESMRYAIFVFLVLFFANRPTVTACEIVLEEIPGDGCWIDPRISQHRLQRFRVTAWFEQQLLGDGLAYQRRIASLQYRDVAHSESMFETY